MSQAPAGFAEPSSPHACHLLCHRVGGATIGITSDHAEGFTHNLYLPCSLTTNITVVSSSQALSPHNAVVFEPGLATITTLMISGAANPDVDRA